MAAPIVNRSPFVFVPPKETFSAPPIVTRKTPPKARIMPSHAFLVTSSFFNTADTKAVQIGAVAMRRDEFPAVVRESPLMKKIWYRECPRSPRAAIVTMSETGMGCQPSLIPSTIRINIEARENLPTLNARGETWEMTHLTKLKLNPQIIITRHRRPYTIAGLVFEVDIFPDDN
mgnify:CR=1 FL=1